MVLRPFDCSDLLLGLGKYLLTCHLLNGYELQACLDFVKSAKKKIDKLEKAKKHGSNDRNTDG